MIISIRDDDTCFFTKPEQLSDIYSDYWHICPVTLSVTPFIDAFSFALAPKEYRQETKRYPLGENAELVSFLQSLIKKGYVGISMHGYSHEKINGKPEFVGGKELYRKTREGKIYLENLLGCRMNTFVPPNNSISVRGTKAVINAGMNILTAYGFYPWERPINYQTLKSFLRLFRHYLKYKRHYPYPGLLNCGTHKEHACVNLGIQTTLEELKNSFHFLKERNANMCFSVHYIGLCYQAPMRRIFNNFMDYLISNFGQEVEFATVDKLFKTN